MLGRNLQIFTIYKTREKRNEGNLNPKLNLSPQMDLASTGIFNYATALELICSITRRIPIQIPQSEKTSTMLPLSVKGDS